MAGFGSAQMLSQLEIGRCDKEEDRMQPVGQGTKLPQIEEIVEMSRFVKMADQKADQRIRTRRLEMMGEPAKFVAGIPRDLDRRNLGFPVITGGGFGYGCFHTGDDSKGGPRNPKSEKS